MMATMRRIDGTLTLSEATRRRWDAIVVGAGISGCVMAAGLARRGQAVLIVDRGSFPRAKTCGGTLNPRAVAVLDRMGFMPVLESLGCNCIAVVEWRSGATRRARLNLPESGHPALAVSRERLDAALLSEAVALGAQFLPGTRFLGTSIVGDDRTVSVRSGGDVAELRTGLLIGCDGIHSAVARSCGLARRIRARYIGCSAVLEGMALSCIDNSTITMAIGATGYAGVVKVEDDQWNIAAAIRVKGGIAPAAQAVEILRSAGIAVRGNLANDRAGWTHTPPGIAWRVSRPQEERLLLVGDARGYAEPVTGEGMAWALEGAERAVALLADGWQRDTGLRWERLCGAGRVRDRTMVSLAGFVVRHPVLARAAVGMLGAAPGVGNLIGQRLVAGRALVDGL